MDFKQEILKSIQSLINKKLNSYHADHTFRSIIKRVTPKGYVILDEAGSERTVPCCVPGVELKTGDNVFVKIPNGNLKQIHIIGIDRNAKVTTTANKIGASTVGNPQKPIYISEGLAAPCNSTVGSPNRPVYIMQGEFTACNSSVGNASKPVYMNHGEITACSSSALIYSGTEPADINPGDTWIDS